MKPVNNKSLLHFIFEQMSALESGKIGVDQAKAFANLAKQANNSLKYELERTTLQIEISKYNIESGKNIELREAEIKNFD